MKKLLMVLVAATIALSVTACKKKPETTGDKVNNAIEKATDAAKDATDKAKEATK
jgi:ABC-type transporter MlaC component